MSLAALIGVSAAAYAGPGDMSPGKWTRETHRFGSKVTVDMFHRSQPYALTGGAREAQDRSAARPWTRETHRIGNKVTVDVFHR